MSKVPTAIVQFGDKQSVLAVAARGAFGGKGTFVVPVFPPRCVCCNADTLRTQDYDPSTDKVTAPSVPMPVCRDCSKHALQTQFVPIMMACLLIVGIAVTALGFLYRAERPHDSFLLGMIFVGFALTAAAVFWIVLTQMRDKREQVAGHHPRLVFSVAHGRTVLYTKNQQLADDLVRFNSSAIRVKK